MQHGCSLNNHSVKTPCISNYLMESDAIWGDKN
jgi:hypothetical protein